MEFVFFLSNISMQKPKTKTKPLLKILSCPHFTFMKVALKGV